MEALHERVGLRVLWFSLCVGLLLVALPAQALAFIPGITPRAIRDEAASHAEGSYGGQCKVFVNDVFAAVAGRAGSGATLGGGYYAPFLNAGGVEVSAADAIPGDIIQLNKESDRDCAIIGPNNAYDGMHSAIVNVNKGGGNFQVVDSNAGSPAEQVHTHDWNPFTQATQYGLGVHIWRMGPGDTWTGSSSDYSLSGVSFPDGDRGWAVGQSIRTGAGVIMRTTNGGASWTNQPAPKALRAVSCPDASHGWAVGEGGTILAMTATKDGAAHWTQQPWDMKWQGVTPDSVVLTGVHFADPLHGWAVGLEWVTWYPGDSYEYMVVIKTDDGGKTWTQQPANLGNVGLSTASIDCVDSEHAWVVLNGVVISTADGGSTWRWGIPTINGYYGLNSAHFENASHGWAAGWTGLPSKGAIFVTDDGGLTWSIQADNLDVLQLRSISFSDGQRGVAVGYRQATHGGSSCLWATSDGGAHWTQQQSPTPGSDSYLESVSSPDSHHACAVGSGQVFLYGPESSPAGTPQQPYSPLVCAPAAGSKPTIVLIGGLWSDYAGADPYNPPDPKCGWHDTYDYLSSKYDVYVPEMRDGHPSEDVMDSAGGYLCDNWTRLDNWLVSHGVTPGTPVILVGHSMGGLIARGFAESWFRPKSGVKVVGIYQIDTPNLGSPLADIGQYMELWPLTVDSVSVRQLRTGDVGEFNASTSARTSIPTRHVASDFFPDTAKAQIQWWDFLRGQKGQLADALTGAHHGIANDGLVSVASAAFSPPGGGNYEKDWELGPLGSSNWGGLIVHALHGDIWALRHVNWSGADYLPPTKGSATASAVLPDLAQFIARFAASGGISGDPSSGNIATARIGAASVGGASVSDSDLDAASGWKISDEGEVPLSSGSSAYSPFSVEGTCAIVSARAALGTPILSVMTSGGAPVAIDAGVSPGQSMGWLSGPPGHYVANIGLSGTASVVGAYSILDFGPSELRVTAPSQMPAETSFMVCAGVYERGVRRTGDDFVASIGGGAPVTLRDDGVAPDAVAGDGVFTCALVAPPTGTANVTVRAVGTDAEGVDFTRVGHALVAVAVPRASLSGHYAWRSTAGSSGKASGLVFDVGVHASQDCTVQVAGTVTSGGDTVAHPGSLAALSAGADATVTLSVAPFDLQRLDGPGDFALSSVTLHDLTDAGLVPLDAAAPALSGQLAPGTVEYAACSVGLQGSAPTSASTLVVGGVAVCTTETISGVQLSFDEGATWYPAPAPDAGWGSNSATWTCSFTLSEGEYGVIAEALGVTGDPIPGAVGLCSFTVDRTPPKTAATVSPSGWSQAATVTLASDDATGSGVAETVYAIDGGSEHVYTAPFVITAPCTQVTFASIDAAGNREDTRSLSAHIDAVAPTVSDDAPSGWSPSNLAVTLRAHDALSGVASIDYRVSGPKPVSTATTVGDIALVSVADEGTTTIQYSALDAAGNRCATETATARLDKGAPTSAIAGVVAGWATTPVTFSINTSDVLSGVAGVHYELNGGAPQPYQTPVAVGANGTTTVTFWAEDNAGNTETTKSATIRIDMTPPTTTSDAAATYVGSATIGLGASDNLGGSGVAHTYYRLDAGVQTEGTTVSTSGVGSHSLEFWSMDAAGNAETPHKAASFTISAVPPSDTVAPTTASDALASYVAGAAIHLSASDNLGGSGVAHTYFRLDGGAQVEGTTVVVTDPGSHSLEFWSVDAAGNTEMPHKTATFVITVLPPPDTTPPTTACDATGSYVGATTVHLSAADNVGGSGVAHTYYRLDTGSQIEGTSVSVSTRGAHTLEFWSVDVAGNAETPHKTAAFTVTDGVAPSTTSDAVASYANAATIHLSASDDPGGAGVAHTYYRLDGGLQAEGAIVSLSVRGAHTLEFWSVDAAGNAESPHKSASFTITDTIAPSTTCDVVSSYVGTAAVRFTAVDNTGGSGVAHTYYRLDGGAQAGGALMSTTAVGTHALQYWSVDLSGNVEVAHTATFSVAAAVQATSVTIKTSATTTLIGKTPTLSGAVTPNAAIGVNMVVYVMKPGSPRWTYSSNRTVYALGAGAAWQYKYTFKKGMAKGFYRFKAVVPASLVFLTSTSPTTVSIRLK